jgi:hypothetical protein
MLVGLYRAHVYCNPRFRIAAALAAIICLLFSQLAVAAYACPAQLHPAVTATMSQAAERGDDGNGPCAEHDAARPELCLAHCNPTVLSLTHAQVEAPPVMLVALHPLAEDYEARALICAAQPTDLPMRSCAPRLSVLHCCFRI